MGLIKYFVDGSSLSLSDRENLIKTLDTFGYTGTIYIDMEKGLYQFFLDERIDIHSLPLPNGTILRKI